MDSTTQNTWVRESGENECILVVDDDSNNRFLITTHLRSAGFLVREARSGEEAIQMVSTDPPDAVVLDLILPAMNGFDVCRHLKQSETTHYIPIVLVTALHGNDERFKGLDSGADDFITKPINKTELLTRIKSLLRIKRLHDALETKISELEKAEKKLKKLAVTDGLTGLFNFRAFRSQIHLEVIRSKRFGLPVSLMMLDIDHFKTTNDHFGHLVGDKVLKHFSRLLFQNVREVDCLARYGGDEFAIILPGTDKNSSTKVSEKLRLLVERAAFRVGDGTPSIRMTVSIGVASHPEDADDEEELIRLTDEALYRAKKSGRNLTCTI